MVSSSVTVCLKNVVYHCGSPQIPRTNRICNVILQAPSSLCIRMSNSHQELKYSIMLASRTNSYSSFLGSQVLRGSCFGYKLKNGCNFLTVRSMHNHRSSLKTCFDSPLGSHKLNLQLLLPRKARIHWSQRTASAWLFIGLLICYSSSKPVHADAPEAKGDQCDSSSVYSHGKKVYTDYSVIGIPGDGRCLFRSIAHGACLTAGKPAPDESIQRELADELRARVADEFVKRRKETEWFIEGDFDAYISQMRKPHVWGGEPELLMASHVLQMPITVYMHDQDSGGLISIAEYGQEYGKDNPIKVLYHGFGHYDALQIPGKKNARSRL